MADLPIGISPNICSPYQPITKKAFIAKLKPKPNLTQPTPLPNPEGHVFLSQQG